MYPVPGHLAFSILGNRYFHADWIPVIIGGILPDIIDKPLNDLFHITPYGRYAMHSFFGLFVATLIAYWLFNRKTAYSYMIGHISHLIADVDFNPWFWPFVEYKFPSGIDVLDILRAPSTIFFPSWILWESVLLGLAVFLYSRHAEKRTVQAAVLTAFAAIAIYRITRRRNDVLAAS
ncbi:MAG: metal-dependent hydrolase [Candidatus Omnitrophica bacterium]|nr:metal-dependent hydrolase [Candidatus Omnitrophota bacterium]